MREQTIQCHCVAHFRDPGRHPAEVVVLEVDNSIIALEIYGQLDRQRSIRSLDKQFPSLLLVVLLDEIAVPGVHESAKPGIRPGVALHVRLACFIPSSQVMSVNHQDPAA